MTAITPSFEVPATTTRPPPALVALLGLAALTSAAQAGFSAAELVFPVGSGWEWWALLILHVAMVAGPIALAAWTYLGLVREGRAAIRPVAHLLRICVYVAI